MENQTTQELKERLDVIESMLAEGRRKCESWGWAFVLWGVAYYVAIAWSVLGRYSAGSRLAWPVTMIAAAVVTGIVASRTKRSHPGTTVGRAMSAIWSVMGTVLFVVLISLGFSGRSDLHLVVVIAAAMLAVANGISSIILRWKMQFACAVVWLVTAVGACFAGDAQLAALSLAALFLCQIVFGVYAMILDSRRRRQGEAAHA